MRTKLNILLIEDSENDAILIMRELGKIDTNAVFERVDNAIALNKALEKEWDIIISDYSMPGFGGTEALKMVRKRNEDIPFIIVSGTIGEDVAVETMRNGANDYLMKNNLKRLNAAVLRELKDFEIKKERKLIKEQLREKEFLYKTLVETSPDSIVLIDVTGKVIIANNKAAIIAGIDDVNEVIGKSIFDFMVPEELERVKKDLNDSILNKKNKNFEQRLLRKDGSIVNVEANVGPIFDYSGELKYFILITRDITERKQAEIKIERLNRVYSLLSSVNKMIVRCQNADELYRDTCNIAVEIGKYKMVWIGLVDENDNSIKPAAWQGDAKDYLDGLAIPLDKSSEELGTAGLAVAGADKIICNDIEKDETIKIRRNKALNNNFRSTASFPLRIDDKSIGVISFYSSSKNFFDEREVILLEELSEDLSYSIYSIQQEQLKKKAEVNLQISESRYKDLFENAAIAIWEEDLSDVKKYIDELKENGVSDFSSYFAMHMDEVVKCASMAKLLDVNGEVLNIVKGSTKEEVLLGLPNFFVEESIEGATEELIGLSEGKSRIDGEMPIKILNGKIIQILYQLTIVPGYEDNWSKVLFSFVDITERKEIEKSLRLFRLLMDKSKDAIEVIDMETGEFTDVNEKACIELGYKRSELLRMNIFDIDPNQNIQSFKLLIPKLQGTNSMMLESLHRRKDGTTFPVELNIAVVKLEKLFTVVMVRDITERKIAEKELAASEERYRQLFQSAAEGIVVVDVESKEYKYVNNAACKMFGYSEQEMIGMNVADLHPPENLSSVISEFESKGSEKINMSIDIPCLRKDGTIFYATFNKAVADIDGRQHNIGFITDTTAQKKALEKIKFLANALESINECVSITDLNDNLTFVNSAFCKSYGYEYSEIIGKNYNLIRSENNPEELSSEIQLKTLDGGWSGELLNKRKNGQEFPIYLYTSKINNDKGDIIGLLGISTDITERKKNEEQIVTSELQFRSVWENSFDSMRLCDSNGIIVSVNPAFCRLVGKSVNELEGLPFISAYDPAESNGLHSFKNNLKNNSIKQKMESKIILWNKKEIWVELSNSIVLLEGKPKMVLSVIREITERKHAEEEIRKLYRGVQQSPATVVITDKSGKIEYVNNKFFETTGYSNSEAIGQNPRILKSGEKTKKEYKELWDAILSGNEWHGELHNKKKNGELYWESATISPIINEKGEITHFIAIKEDITEHKMMVEELISAKEKAEEMNRLKTNFVNNMSHEMRTPLVAILGYSQFLISDIENKYHKEMLEGIENSGKRLLDTVNSILDLSRMEAKKIDFKLTEVDVIKETDGVINRMSILAWNKNLYLRLDKKSENVFSLLNVKYFVHILEKLLSNSIKYTIKGGVTIEIEKNIQDGESWSVIKVIDTGIGISKESHELIFEEFRQASEGLNRQFEGTGLGLTLTKKYVSLMNGKITVDSKPGQGSIFTVMFKSINTAPKKNGKGEQIELEINTIHSTKKEIIKPTGKEILVVEDDNFSRDIVRLLLKDLYKIKFAENGEMAIQLVENKIYDCILMDVNLGLGMSGLEATAKIKQIKGYEGIPIIAVTAYAMQGDKEKFLSSGFTQYISKPYKKETILNVLKEALNSK